ncbi:hypothetical protein LXL04_011843 [Taraxacum kok-saghyz]
MKIPFTSSKLTNIKTPFLLFPFTASEKVLEDMVAMAQDVRTDEQNRTKAVQLIRAWGESEELMYLPVFRQTHLEAMRQWRVLPKFRSGLVAQSEERSILFRLPVQTLGVISNGLVNFG